MTVDINESVFYQKLRILLAFVTGLIVSTLAHQFILGYGSTTPAGVVENPSVPIPFTEFPEPGIA